MSCDSPLTLLRVCHCFNVSFPLSALRMMQVYGTYLRCWRHWRARLAHFQSLDAKVEAAETFFSRVVVASTVRRALAGWRSALVQKQTIDAWLQVRMQHHLVVPLMVIILIIISAINEAG